MAKSVGLPPWQQGGGPRPSTHEALLAAKGQQDWQEDLQRRMAAVQLQQAEAGVRMRAIELALAFPHNQGNIDNLIEAAGKIETYLIGPVAEPEQQEVQSSLFTTETGA